jgi:hypothetical protein
MTTGGRRVKDAAGRRGRTAIAPVRGRSYGPALFKGPAHPPDHQM